MSNQISPLRYPGGKAKLYPYISQLIADTFDKPPVYCEPFAGGFGLGIALLLHGDVSEVLINDFDYCIFAFWNCVVQDNAFEELLKRIDQTEINIDEWKKQRNIFRNYQDYSMEEVGFATLYLNRCNRSGILDANPIGGINQTGKYKMNCRFNKNNIKRTITRIHEKSEKISVYHKDASVFLPWIDKKKRDMLVNLDPPYFNAGPMIYKNNFTEKDHINLGSVVKSLHNRWIMTYDDTQMIRNIYNNYLIREYQLSYYLAQKKRVTELIIFDHKFVDPPKL